MNHKIMIKLILFVILFYLFIGISTYNINNDMMIILLTTSFFMFNLFAIMYIESYKN